MVRPKQFLPLWLYHIAIDVAVGYVTTRTLKSRPGGLREPDPCWHDIRNCRLILVDAHYRCSELWVSTRCGFVCSSLGSPFGLIY